MSSASGGGQNPPDFDTHTWVKLERASHIGVGVGEAHARAYIYERARSYIMIRDESQSVRQILKGRMR